MQSAIGTTFDVGITTLTDVDAISRIAYDIRDMAVFTKTEHEHGYRYLVFWR